MVTWCEEPTHWKRPWFWERLRAGGEGGDRRRDGWMASLTQWTWVWESFRRWWWTGKPGVLKSMGSQRVEQDWVTEQQQQQFWFYIQFSSVAQSCGTLCDPMNCSTPGLPVHYKLPEFTQTHVHRVGDAIQPSQHIPKVSHNDTNIGFLNEPRTLKSR